MAVSQNKVHTVTKCRCKTDMKPFRSGSWLNSFCLLRFKVKVFTTLLGNLAELCKSQQIIVTSIGVLHQRMQLQNIRLIIKLSYYHAINVSFQHNHNISHHNMPLIMAKILHTAEFHLILVNRTISGIIAQYNLVKICNSSKQELQLMYFSFWISCSER